jgi:putative intracellular protease/amidase
MRSRRHLAAWRDGPLIVDYEAAMPTGRGGEMADDLKGMKVAILATDGVDVSVEDCDAQLLPGGSVNPDGLRIDPHAVGFVKAFVATGKPVAGICHGPWTLIEADVVRGHRFTSWPSLWTDPRLAGAEAVEEELAIDGQFTSSRFPADLPAFCPAMVAQFAKAGVPGQAPGGMR